MPADTPPFGWGPASFDEWDLDDLLSGRLSDTPPALRQVADALIALRAAPTPGELGGQAAIMAEFSALTNFSALTELRAAGPRDAARAGRADTLVLPGPRPGAPGHRRARHRSRRTGPPLTWRAGALVGVAAAAILMIVAFTGVLPAPIRNIARLTTSSPSVGHPTAGNSQTHSVTGSGTHEQPSQSQPPATQPAAIKPADRRKLCRAWFADFRHSQSDSGGAAESALFWRISQLAGGPEHVFRYCAQDLEHMFPHKNPWFRDDGTGSQQGDQGNNGSGSDSSGSDSSGGASSGGTSSSGTSSAAGNGPGPAKSSGKGSAKATIPAASSQG